SDSENRRRPRPCSFLRSRESRRSFRRSRGHSRARIARSGRETVRVPESGSDRSTGPQWTCLLALPQKVLDGLVDVVFVFDAGRDEVIHIRNIVFELADELAAAVGAFDLAVT